MQLRNIKPQNSTQDKTQQISELSLGITDATNLRLLHEAISHVSRVYDPLDLRPDALDVALILKKLGVDTESLIAALLSDPRLRNSQDSLTIELQFNPAIANLVKHVTWLNTFKECTESSDYLPVEAEALHRMLLATVDDVRAVVIKLAFRLQRLRGLANESKNIQKCVAQETFGIYTPLANRLGLSTLQWEMEDLCFRYQEPETYASLAVSMSEKRVYRETYIENFVNYLQLATQDLDIAARIYGRPKHLCSIWKKMRSKKLALNELADLLAIRIIVPDLSDCYRVLQRVHGEWRNIVNEFDDYIANPKENGYQSIHTAIFGPENRIVEIQIRTREMHDFAEHGVAAHWRYKEGSNQDKALLKSIAALRRLLDNRIDDSTLLEEFKTEFFNDRVLVLTPKKEVIDLPKGATALDFAYSIHTDIGHQCIGAYVNAQRVPLSYALKSGECVEILVDKKSTPHFDWLNERKRYVNTIRAKASIRQWFRLYFKHDNNQFMVTSDTLQGIGKLQVKTSDCCNPQPGDRIMGELKQDEAINVHRYDCTKICSKRFSEKHNIVELYWGLESTREKVSIHIDAFDRQGLLLDITKLLNQSQCNVLKANTETDSVDQSVAMELTFELNSRQELDLLLKKVLRIANVLRVVEL